MAGVFTGELILREAVDVFEMVKDKKTPSVFCELSFFVC